VLRLVRLSTSGRKFNTLQWNFNAAGGRTFNASRRNINTPGRKVNAWQRTFNTHGRLPLPLVDLGRGGGRPHRVGIIHNFVWSYRV
jgi:hypothetical protein